MAFLVDSSVKEELGSERAKRRGKIRIIKG
jgi:hypothetical protein